MGFLGLILTMIFTPTLPAFAAPTYLDGVSPPLVPGPAVVVGDHLVSPDPFPSVAGVGGSGLNDAAGSALDGQRTYIWDQGAQADLTDGVSTRGVPPFAMMIWDMGAPFNSMRLYTHQDHIFDAPNTGPLGIVTNFVAQDVMEYSVWGSNDGNNFVLLSDVTGFNIVGGGPGKPTYTFSGTEPTTIYRGGSFEFGSINAYTRDYTFPNSYQYYGIRTSQVSLTIPPPSSPSIDADPEIDAVVGFNACPPETIGDYPHCAPIGGVIGGEIIPLDTTALLISGSQTSTVWMMPVIAGIAGAVLLAYRLRR
jgi:hypothetical protein